jgi:hypothetical protein
VDVQVLHVPGTYWYYDLKNLTDEVVDRARPGAVHQSIASRLDMILAYPSPIILGYSGGRGLRADDRALRRRRDPGGPRAGRQGARQQGRRLRPPRPRRGRRIAYDRLIDRYGDDESPALREQVALALRNKGVALAGLGRQEEAVAVHALAVERFGDDESAPVREHVATALTNSAGALRSLGREEEAVAAFEQVVERYAADGLAAVQDLVATAREALEPPAAEDAPGEPD